MARIGSEIEKWHPILAAEEFKPGQWVMLDALQQPYGMIRFLRRGDELGYRADRWSQDVAGRSQNCNP